MSGTAAERSRPTMRTCTAYRRRGPTWGTECDFIFALDLVPAVTGCEDPRVFAAYLRRPVTGICARTAAGCV